MRCTSFAPVCIAITLLAGLHGSDARGNLNPRCASRGLHNWIVFPHSPLDDFPPADLRETLLFHFPIHGFTPLSLSFDENFIIGIYQRSVLLRNRDSTRLIDVFVSRRKDRFLLVAVSCLTIVVFDIAPCGYVGRDVCLSFFLWRKFRLIGRQRSSSSRMILYFLEVTCNVMILRRETNSWRLRFY